MKAHYNVPSRKAHSPRGRLRYNSYLFHYTMTRNGEHAKELLDGWHGSLVTDAYAGYEKVEKITHGLCWSHVRRNYIDSIPLDSSGKEIPGSKGAEARKRIDQLFYIEGLLKGFPKECYRANNPEKDEENLCLLVFYQHPWWIT